MARISLDRMTEIAAECDKYEITLANDPTVLGPKYLQDLIATCRNYTNNTARLLNEVYRAKMEIDMELRRKQTAFKIAADELLVKDVMVRALPNIKDRESQINSILKDEHREILNLENELLDLGHSEEYVQRRHRELVNSMKAIQTQRNLILDEHQTGRMYGDERPLSMGGGDPSAAFTPGGFAKPEGMDEEAIEKMLKEGCEEEPKTDAVGPTDTVQISSPVETEPTEVLVATVAASTEETEIKAFLDSGADSTESAPLPVVPNVAVEDDFSALLNSL